MVLLFYGRGYGLDRPQAAATATAVPLFSSNVFWHSYHIDICLLIFATFQRILKLVARFRRKLA